MVRTARVITDELDVVAGNIRQASKDTNEKLEEIAACLGEISDRLLLLTEEEK